MMKATLSADEAADRYGYPAMFFHWSLAVLVPAQIGIGWYMLSIEDQPGSGWYFALHISLGLTAALLIVLRSMWRVRQVPPVLPGTVPAWQAVLPGTVPAWQAKAARISHALLYTLMLLMPLTGYLGAAFSGEAIGYFGLPLPSWSAKNEALKEQFFTAHSVIAWLLVAMVMMHVGAALKHLLIDKDTVFRRMWPR